MEIVSQSCDVELEKQEMAVLMAVTGSVTLNMIDVDAKEHALRNAFFSKQKCW